jgi:formate-dependent nitrite reductase cytochrome c552 subunit
MVLELVDDLPLSTLMPERLPQVNTGGHFLTDLQCSLHSTQPSQLCALLHEQSADVQVTAQTQLQRMIKARTSDLVVQVEVDSDAKVDIKLPQELIDVIAASLEATRTSSEEDLHMSIVQFYSFIFVSSRCDPSVRG